MRRLIIVGLVFIGTVGTAGASWLYLRPHDKLAEARQLMAKGDARSAELVLRSVVQANPELTEARFRLAQVQLRTGDAVAAEKELRAARAQGWDVHVLTPLLAQAVEAQGRNEEVLRDYTLDGLTPDQAAATLVIRAAAQMALQRPDDATASITQAQHLAPQSLEVALAAARFARLRNDPAAFAANIDAALAIDPHALEALMLQAALRVDRKDNQGALASYAAALQQAQSVGAANAADMARVGRAWLLLSMGDDAAARADVDAVLKTMPRSPAANFLSARLLARSGDWKGANAALALIGPVLSRLPGGDMLLAEVKSNLNDPEQALAAAERQVVHTPNDLNAVKLLARLDLSQKRPAAAAQVLTATSAALDGEALDMLGNAYVAGGQPAKAVETLRRASALMPDNTRVLTQLAALELSQGRPGQAAQALDRALDVTGATAAANSAGAAITTVATRATAEPRVGGSSQGRPTETPARTADAGPAQTQTTANLVVVALQAGDIDRAVAALSKLRQLKADPTEVALLTGMVKLAQIDLAGAAAAFQEAQTLDPKAAAPRINMARVLALQGRDAEAIATLQELLASDPGNAAALTPLVNLLVSTNQPDKAVAVAEAAQRAAPGNMSIALGLAELYSRTNHPDKALALLDTTDKAAAGTPNAALLELRAQAQLNLGQQPAAEQTLQQLLDSAPDNAVARRQLAELMAFDKNYDGARALLRDGLTRNPGNGILMAASVAIANAEGGPTLAVARADELSRNPANAAPTLKADVLMSQRKFTEARDSYQTIMNALPKGDPNASRLQVRIAQATAAAGDPARAASMLRSWMAAHPDDANVMLSLSELDLAANRIPEARTQLDAVLVQQPNNPAVLNNLAWISQQQGDLPRARTLATRAYLLSPSPQSADTLGWIILAQGQTSNAVALLREAAKGPTQDPAIQYHLAAALAKDGQKDAAVTLLRTLVTKPAAGFNDRPQAVTLLSQLSAP
jgi:tetratricopeptide (TPR) repeat protein